jgi:hypothetical protein
VTIAMSRREELARQARYDATNLACRVRDDQPRDVWTDIVALEQTRLLACCIALAAMVPVDRPVSELLAWTDEFDPEIAHAAELRSAHAAHARGETAAWVRHGEREYQRVKTARARARKAVA